MSRLPRKIVSLLLLLVTTAGCYRYIPIESETAPLNENVRIFVTRSAMLDLEEAVQMTGPSVRGRIVRRDNQQLFVRVPVGARQVGFHSQAIDQEVPIPVSEIIQVERREFNRVGTGAFIAGGIGATAVVLFLIIEAYGQPEFEEPCEDCADLRVPLLSIPFR